MSTEADCPLSAMARAEIVGGAIVSVLESRSDDESVGLICDRIKGAIESSTHLNLNTESC
jgi:hypothetical protein